MTTPTPQILCISYQVSPCCWTDLWQAHCWAVWGIRVCHQITKQLLAGYGMCVFLSLHQVMSHCDVWWYHNDIIYSACKASLLPLACESLYNRRCYVSIRSAQLCILQVPLIVIFIGYSCFSTCLTFPFAGGSIHGATVIVSRTLRVVKLFSVLNVLGCHDSSHNKQQQNYSDIHPEGEDFMWRTPGFVLSPPQQLHCHLQ